MNAFPTPSEGAGHDACVQGVNRCWDLLQRFTFTPKYFKNVLCKAPHTLPLCDARLWACRRRSAAKPRSIPEGSGIAPCPPRHPDPGSTREPGSPGDLGLCRGARAQT